MAKQEAENRAIVRKALLTAALEPAKTVSRVEIKEIEFEPGQSTGAHLHPCPVMRHITKGAALLQVEGQQAQRLDSGDAFYEPANVRILRFDNASGTAPMTFIAFYLLGENESELIQML